MESGGKIIPIVFSLTGHDGRGPDDKQIKSSIRNDWMEEFLASLSGSPSGKPLFTTSELAGAYQMSASTLGPQFYNATTGASVGYAYVARSSKLTLNGDGTFEAQNYGATGIGGPAHFAVEKGKGRFQLVRDGVSIMLVQRDAATGHEFKEHLAGAFTLPGDAGKVLITLPMGLAVTPLNIAQTSDHYLTKPPVK